MSSDVICEFLSYDANWELHENGFNSLVNLGFDINKDDSCFVISKEDLFFPTITSYEDLSLYISGVDVDYLSLNVTSNGVNISYSYEPAANKFSLSIDEDSFMALSNKMAEHRSGNLFFYFCEVLGKVLNVKQWKVGHSTEFPSTVKYINYEGGAYPASDIWRLLNWFENRSR